MNQAMKTYLYQFSISMIAYVVVLIISITLIRMDPELFWRIPLAIAPVIPIMFALFAYLRCLNQMDELQQRIQFNAIAFAGAATGIFTFTYGFLENVGFPQLSWIWVFPMLILFWGFGLAIATRRYQ